MEHQVQEHHKILEEVHGRPHKALQAGARCVVGCVARRSTQRRHLLPPLQGPYQQLPCRSTDAVQLEAFGLVNLADLPSGRVGHH